MAFTLIKAFGNSVSTAVKLDAYDVEYTTGKARSLCLKLRCDVRHARVAKDSFRFHPGDGAEVFTWQNFPFRLPRSRSEKPRSREPSHPALSYEQVENFTRDLEVRRDLRNPARTVNRVHVQRLLPKH